MRWERRSIVVTHDVQESLQIVDYIYFVSDGKIVAQGTPDEIRASTDPWVHQFVWAEADGPVPFHYPAAPYGAQILGAERCLTGWRACCAASATA